MPLFEQHAKAWLQGSDPADEKVRASLDRCQAIALAAATALEARELLECTTRAKAFDAAERDRLREAQRILEAGQSAYDRSAGKEAIGPVDGAEAAFAELGWTVGCARSSHLLGRAHLASGDYPKAITHTERALALREKIGNPQDIAASLANLGVSYVSLGQYEKAIKASEQALEIREKIGNQQSIAKSLNDLGGFYQALGQLEKAIGYHERALALREKIGEPQDIATSSNNLGGCYLSLGQAEKAIGYLERALALLKKIGNPPNIAASLSNLGNGYFRLGEFEKAIGYLEQALALNEKFGTPQDHATCLGTLGHCYRSLGQNEKALASFERCVAALNRVGRRTLSEAGRAAFASEWSSLPAIVSQCVHGLVNQPSARATVRGFPLIDSFVGRTLLEGLQERAEGALATADPNLSARRTELLDRMVELRLKLEKDAQGSPGENDASPVATELRTTIEKAENDLEEADHQLRRKNPRLGELLAPEAASLEAVQKEILTKDQALLLFLLHEKESSLWIVTNESATVLSLPAEAAIRKEHDALVGRLADVAAANASFAEPARSLYRMLLAEAEPLLASRSHWIVVPDGFLAFLPFDVLLTRDVKEDEKNDLARLPYLLRRRTVSYAPSASVLLWQSRHGTRTQSWKKDLLLLGDPIYGGSEPPDGDLLAARMRGLFGPDGFQRIQKTRDEVISLALNRAGEEDAKSRLQIRDLARSGAVSASRFDLYVGQEANKSRLRGDLRNYRAVHLAVHGFFDPQFPWFSGLALSEEAASGSGFVNLVELAMLDLGAEIVFLSACETAKGTVLKAEGAKSAARSLLLSGARSVVATQWSVADEAAPIVAAAFYRRLFAGTPSGEALRQAKVALLDGREGPLESGNQRGVGAVATEKASASEQRRWAHPAFWAPFVMWGR